MMIYKTKNTTDKTVATLVANIGVRYWEDGQINGEDDNNDAPKMPMIDGGRWKLRIDLDTGVIADWPQGSVANVHYKVCDDGVYSLIDTDGKQVVKIDGYVPSMLSPDGDGYGDYVIMDIDADGKINKWRADLSYFDEQSDDE